MLTDVDAIVIPVCARHILVDIGIDARHFCYRVAQGMRSSTASDGMTFFLSFPNGDGGRGGIEEAAYKVRGARKYGLDSLVRAKACGTAGV